MASTSSSPTKEPPAGIIKFLRPDWNRVAILWQAFRNRLPAVPVIILIVMVGWILSGLYIVAPDEVGVVLRFGKLSRTTEPGPHYHWPFPIEAVDRLPVGKIERFEFGFRTIDTGPPPRYEPVSGEGLMLTGDQSIIDLWFIVQVKIDDPTDFLFQVADPYRTLRDTAEAATCEVMGSKEIDVALTTGRFEIQNEVHKNLQDILESYGCGLQVLGVQLQAVQPPGPVRDSFRDVVLAQEEKSRSINEAQGYSNDLLPKAAGMAVQIEHEAQAYKVQRIQRAQGDTARFLARLKEYRKAPDVTRKRLYLETMEKILSRVRKLVVDPQQAGVVPMLPMQFPSLWETQNAQPTPTPKVKKWDLNTAPLY